MLCTFFFPLRHFVHAICVLFWGGLLRAVDFCIDVMRGVLGKMDVFYMFPPREQIISEMIKSAKLEGKRVVTAPRRGERTREVSTITNDPAPEGVSPGSGSESMGPSWRGQGHCHLH